MMIGKNLVLTLDDNNKYVVVSKVKFKEKEYIYLADISNSENYMFGRLEGNKITKITDLNLFSKLVLLFCKKN